MCNSIVETPCAVSFLFASSLSLTLCLSLTLFGVRASGKNEMPMDREQSASTVVSAPAVVVVVALCNHFARPIRELLFFSVKAKQQRGTVFQVAVLVFLYR